MLELENLLETLKVLCEKLLYLYQEVIAVPLLPHRYNYMTIYGSLQTSFEKEVKITVIYIAQYVGCSSAKEEKDPKFMSNKNCLL